MPQGKTSTKLCNICNKEISLFAYNRHVKSHSNIKQEPRKTNNINGNCKFCNKLFNTQIALHNHEYRCKLNSNRILHPLTEAGKLSIIESNKNNKWSDERKQKHSESMKKAVLENPESYTSSNVCGRVKIQDYKGEKFHGKWELEVAKWLDNNSIKWERQIKPFDYFWNNSWHLYFPDFYLPELDLYLEIKGYETDRDKCKWQVVPNLKVIKQTEIKLIKENKYTLR